MIINEQVEVKEEVELTEIERLKQLEAEIETEPKEEVEGLEEDIKPYIEDQNGKIYEFKTASRALYKIISPFITGKQDFDKAVEKIMWVQHGMGAADCAVLFDYLFDELGPGNLQVLLVGIVNQVLTGKNTKNRYVEQAIAKAEAQLKKA